MTTDVQKRLAIEKQVILKMIEICEKHGYALTGGNDGEERHSFTDPVTAIGMVFSVDESHLYFRHPSEPKGHNVFLVLGNDGWDVVADHSCSDLFDAAMAELNEWTDTEWEKAYQASK